MAQTTVLELFAPPLQVAKAARTAISARTMTAYKHKPVTTHRAKMTYAPISIQAPAIISLQEAKLISVPAIAEMTMQEERLRMMPISITKQIEKQLQEERLRVASITGQRMAQRQIVDTDVAQVQLPGLVQEVIPKVAEIIKIIPDVVIITPKITIPKVPKIPIRIPKPKPKPKHRHPRKKAQFKPEYWQIENPIASIQDMIGGQLQQIRSPKMRKPQ